MRASCLVIPTLLVIAISLMPVTSEGNGATGGDDGLVVQEAATSRKWDDDGDNNCVGEGRVCHKGSCCSGLTCKRVTRKRRTRRCVPATEATSNCRDYHGFCNDGTADSGCCNGLACVSPGGTGSPICGGA